MARTEFCSRRCAGAPCFYIRGVWTVFLDFVEENLLRTELGWLNRDHVESEPRDRGSEKMAFRVKSQELAAALCELNADDPGTR